MTCKCYCLGLSILGQYHQIISQSFCSQVSTPGGKKVLFSSIIFITGKTWSEGSGSNLLQNRTRKYVNTDSMSTLTRLIARRLSTSRANFDDAPFQVVIRISFFALNWTFLGLNHKPLRTRLTTKPKALCLNSALKWHTNLFHFSFQRSDISSTRKHYIHARRDCVDKVHIGRFCSTY